MQIEQISLLRLQNQFLQKPADAQDVVSGLIGLQAQYGANALHALTIRASGGYAADDYVKTWTLRGTLHLHAVSDLPLVLYRGSETDFGQMAFTHESVKKDRAEAFRQSILNLLAQGAKTREELRARCRNEGMTSAEEAIFLHPWGGLFRGMAERGEIAYATEGNRLFVRLEPFAPETESDAIAELTRRYLAHYGPVTLRDTQTFFGMPQRTLKPFLESAAGETLTIGKDVYYLAPGWTPPDKDAPDALFLAGFDPLLMGYRKTENPVLPPEFVKRVYNNTGIVFPTVLLHGKVAALWRRAGDRAEVAPLVKIGVRDRKRIERKAVDKHAFTGVEWVES